MQSPELSTDSSRALKPSRPWARVARPAGLPSVGCCRSNHGSSASRGAPETWHQAVHATALASDGIVSHRSAAELWGLIKPAGYAEVSVRPDRNPRVRPPAIVHRIGDLHPRLAVERECMQITDPLRTIIDLGLVAPTWTVNDALSRGLTTRLFTIGEVQDLRDALGRPGRTGTGIVRDLIEQRLLTAETEESLLEARFVDLTRSHDLPRPAFQHEVWHTGRFIARIDAAYREIRLGIEVDGYESHASPEAFQRDRARQNYLVALGLDRAPIHLARRRPRPSECRTNDPRHHPTTGSRLTPQRL